MVDSGNIQQRHPIAWRAIALVTAFALVMGMTFPTAAFAAGGLAAGQIAADGSSAGQLAAQATAYTHEFTLSADSVVVDAGTADAVTATGTKVTAADGTYEISKNLKVTITAGGTYHISGTRADVAKGIAVDTVDPVTLVLDGLTLSTTDEAPVTCKKGSNVTVDIEGAVTLADNETDASNSGDPDGAALKVAKYAAATITGTGTLNAQGAYKNGIKGGEGAAIAIGAALDDAVKVNVTAAKNGIACDGALIVNGGTTTVNAGNDGVKSSPEPADTVSPGTIEINGGVLDVTAADEGIVAEPDSETDATTGVTTTNTTAASTIRVAGGTVKVDTTGGDGIRAEGDITITGGAFDIDAAHDGIQTNSDMNIANGTFDIKTSTGYSSSKYTGDDSCKGLKANYATDDNATKDTAAATNALNITGGTFTLNTLDDAVHSDAYCSITGGTFTIDTGDDGVHADTTLTLGSQGGLERDPDITINHSYEGLESGSVFAYSGRYYVIATDDGVNAAGGSSNGSDPSGGQPGSGGPGQGGSSWGNDGFNPGGQPGQGGRGGVRTMSDDAATGGALETMATSGYQIAIAGGAFYVNCDGDGLDSNGALTLTGGDVAVFSMRAGGDNSPIDADGTVSINGATVFLAGSAGMDRLSASTFGSGQKYVISTSSYSANTVVNATSGGTVLASYQLPKNSSYTVYSAPNLSSTPTLSTASAVTSCKGGSWSHAWNSGTTASGVTTYTCSKCGEAERQSVADTVTPTATAPVASEAPASDTESGTDSGTTDSTDAGFAVTFAGDAGVKSVIVYKTQDTAGESETLSATGSTVSRNSSTGAADSTGDGQVNFTVVLNDGYQVASVAATEGAYKNIKDLTATLANTYRITKITGPLTVTVTTTSASTGGSESGTGATSGTGSDSGSGTSAEGAEGTEGGTGATSGDGGNTTSGTGSDGSSGSGSSTSADGTATGTTTGTTTGGTSASATGASTTTGTFKTDIANATIAKVTNKVYTGSPIKLVPVVKMNGTTLRNGTDFTLSYKNNTSAGKATVTIAGKGAYDGSVTKTFIIKPAKVTNVKVRSTASGKVRVTWSKADAKAAKATGYQLRYKNGSKTRLITVAKASTAKRVISRLAAGKKVTVKVRAFKTVDGKRYAGAWSKAASVKVR